MANARKIILVVAALVFVAFGFLIGQLAQAAISLPGSEDDPVVTQSYVEQLVSERTSALRAQIDELQQQIDLLGGNVPVAPSTGDEPSGDDKPEPDNNPSGGTVSSDLPAKVTVTGASVNVRASATTDSSIVGSVKKGDVLTVTAKSSNWYKVKLSDGTVGYVREDLVKVQ